VRWRHLVAATAAAGALAPSASALITIEAGTVQRVEVEFPRDLPREVPLVATIEVPDYLRDQVAIDVLPRELVLRPGESPGVHLQIESDACSPSVYFRARLILRSQVATTATPLYFRVENSPVECWGPVALSSTLVALLLYAVWSWVINLRLFSLASVTANVDTLPRRGMEHRERMQRAIGEALRPGARVWAWLRSGAWWRSLLGSHYYETLEIVPDVLHPQAVVVPHRHRGNDQAIYLEAGFRTMALDRLRREPRGFRVTPGKRRVFLKPSGDADRPGWQFRGTLPR
jgi:hypothetical protein